MASVKGKELKVVALAMIFTFTLSASHAESNISQLETLFLEGRYEKVVSEADRLIESKSYNKEEAYYLLMPRGMIPLTITALKKYTVLLSTFLFKRSWAKNLAWVCNAC